MALKLPDSAVPMGDFPVAKAVDIDFDDGENLQEKLDNGALGGGGGGASTASEVSYSNEALSSVSDVKMALDTIVGEKANTSDLTTHTGDANIHVATTDKAKWDKVTDKLDAVNFNTHKDDTDVHITSAERTKWNKVDNKINKTDITTTINSSSTDDTVPSTKSVYTNILSLLRNQGMTEEQVNSNIETFYIGTVSSDVGQAIGLPLTNGILGKIINIPHGEYPIQLAWDVGKRDNIFMLRKCNGGVWQPWQRVCTTTNLTEMNTKISQLETQVNDLFQSVSDGKTLVANAITDKGVSTSTTATFATMATNISKISGGYKEETISKTFSTTGINILTFTFSANVLAIKQIIAPSDSCSILLQSSKNIFTINGKELIVHVTGSGTWKVTALIQN